MGKKLLIYELLKHINLHRKKLILSLKSYEIELLSHGSFLSSEFK